MIIDRIVLDDSDDDHDDDGGDAQHAGVIPVNGIPSFPPPVRQPEHAQQAHAYHAHKQKYNILEMMEWSMVLERGPWDSMEWQKVSMVAEHSPNNLFVVNKRSGIICINA